METKLINNLEQEGYFNLREVDGKMCGLYRFLFTTGLVVGIDAYGYQGRYCYSTTLEARDALTHWDGKGDPSGEWIKYKGEEGERSRIKDKYEDS